MQFHSVGISLINSHQFLDVFLPINGVGTKPDNPQAALTAVNNSNQSTDCAITTGEKIVKLQTPHRPSLIRSSGVMYRHNHDVAAMNHVMMTCLPTVVDRCQL